MGNKKRHDYTIVALPLPGGVTGYVLLHSLDLGCLVHQTDAPMVCGQTVCVGQSVEVLVEHVRGRAKVIGYKSRIEYVSAEDGKVIQRYDIE